MRLALSLGPNSDFQHENHVFPYIGQTQIANFLSLLIILQVALDVLGFGRPLSDSISFSRLHHQLFPNRITVEDNFPQIYRDGLRSKGHIIQTSDSYAVVQGIHVDAGGMHATSDPRKGGTPAGY